MRHNVFIAATATVLILQGCNTTTAQYVNKEAGWETASFQRPNGGALCMSGRHEAGGRYFLFAIGEGPGEYIGTRGIILGFHDPNWDMSAGEEYPIQLALHRGDETVYESNELGLVVAESNPNKEMLMMFISSENNLENIIRYTTEESDSLHLIAPDTGETAFVVDLTNARVAWWNLLKCNDVSNSQPIGTTAKNPFRPKKK